MDRRDPTTEDLEALEEIPAWVTKGCPEKLAILRRKLYQKA